MQRLSIIIPAYNEAGSMAQVLAELGKLTLPMPHEVICVDDGSTDMTAAIAEAAGVRVIKNNRNLGYGASLKKGIRAATGDYVLLFDGDGQFAASDIARFVSKAQKNDVDMILGIRKNGSAGSPLWRKPGKYIIRALVQYLLGQKLEDINCGFRLFKKEVISRYLHLCSDRFSFSTSSTVAIISRGYGFDTMPVEVRPRASGVSSVSVTTGFDTILLVIRLIMLFNPLKFFMPFGFGFILLGLLWGGRYVIWGHGLSATGLLFLMIGILAIFLGLIADQISELRKAQFEN